METVQKYLEILEFQYIPDPEELQRSFNRLLKECHPDRNRDRQEWANEKTRRLIEALDKVKFFIENRKTSSTASVHHYNSYSYSYYADEDAEQFRSKYSERKEKNDPSVAVQILRTGDTDYVLLLKSIVRVVICNPNHLKKIMNRHFYMHEKTVYVITALDSENADPLGSEYIILYKSGGRNLGFAVPADVRFTRTDRISPREIIYKKDSSGTITEATVQQGGNQYRFPSQALDDLADQDSAA